MASRDHKTGTKTYTSIAHPRLLDQEKPVVYHFLAVSALKYIFYDFWCYDINKIHHNAIFLYVVAHIDFIIGKPKQGEVIKNVQCGYDVRKEQYVSKS